MSRAFVTDKEDWVYCAKAGERCMHAEAGKACRKTDCEYFDRKVKEPSRRTTAIKVVKRKPKDTKDAKAAKAAKPEPTQPRRATKKSTLKKPKKWGGRTVY